MHKGWFDGLLCFRRSHANTFHQAVSTQHPHQRVSTHAAHLNAATAVGCIFNQRRSRWAGRPLLLPLPLGTGRPRAAAGVLLRDSLLLQQCSCSQAA